MVIEAAVIIGNHILKVKLAKDAKALSAAT
jgi:hypothetical protein